MPAAPAKPGKLSPISTLLLQGGDDRIRLLDGAAFNKYGCRPYPVAGCVDFSSSTASHVSASAYDALELLRYRLEEAISASSPEQVYARELQQLRTRFLSLWNVPATTEMIFSASGTDAHLIAASLAQTLHETPLCAIMIQCEESGSGVAAALCGQPFSSRTATGDIPPACAAGDTSTIHIDLRAPGGNARSAAEVDADFERAADRILEQGFPVLLVAVDVSKTGLAAPGMDALARLKTRWGRQLTVLVDACQFRLDSAALHAYLELGCMVAITGSKFFAAPSFCGALLVPAALAQAMQARPMPALLRSYSSSAEWPAHWPGAGELTRVPNLGLLLRWEAALQEMHDFLQVPAEEVQRIVSACAEAVQGRLASDPHFQAPDDSAAVSASNKPPTIHAFIPCRPAPDRKMLERSEVERLYRSLQSTVQADGRMYLLGQPVQCGGSGSSPAWALRLCLSAPLIVNAYRGGEVGLSTLIEQALACLTAVAATIDQL
ncbi:hypothetical protein [Herbaspirillum rhizosphaerae]|uniref:hypothetical protein n=1 Tax=Herbaspirillum rhizosphaerae TaxID=346179 RepID=UPI000A743588|nr:hypothetical protein [Herbaspirillum rhizosphaerae]